MAFILTVVMKLGVYGTCIGTELDISRSFGISSWWSWHGPIAGIGMERLIGCLLCRWQASFTCHLDAFITVWPQGMVSLNTL